ncbi:MAG: AMP-binding protein [Prevotella sp.]|jgi:long-chain acyl-CoA synthetase|nr:AMP-binding protein [Prevotella sp.]MCI2125399.1 AMP-binding protein [Prevotella sp.]
MDTNLSFNSYIEKSIVDNWDNDSLTDYKGTTLQYHDVARKIEKLHILFESCNIHKGDKIAICGRNSANWAVAFLATLTYGAVAVPILHEFTSEQIHNIVNHSEAKILFAGDIIATQIDPEKMPNLEGIIYLPYRSLILSRNPQFSYTVEHVNEIFGKKYPKYFGKEHIHYYHDQPDELALINYTSGTTGFSKGVMLSYQALWSNLDFILNALGPHLKKGSPVLNILPMAHMYGLMVEFLFEFCFGNHIYFLTRLPSPSVIAQAFHEIKPAIIIAVPLIIEKIVRRKIMPLLQTNKMRLLLSMPIVSKKIKENILERVKELFGGNLYEIIIGGAGLNKEVENFFTSIHFPITIGYGTTETAPLITFTNWEDFVPGSCGKPVKNMEVKILSPDPENIPGEIITRGLNVMQGYYKNEAATKKALVDGWFHTGDLGTMDKGNNLFIKGRIKNMLLGADGQNIYPEEIEDKLNSMAMVNESLVIQSGGKLVGLVNPNREEAQSLGFTEEDLTNIMEQYRKQLNSVLPSFCKISQIQLQDKEFEKTPKRSIKRYLYKDMV